MKLFWRSVLSLLVTAFFMVLFGGSLSLLFLNDETKVLENGDYEMTVYLSKDDYVRKTGPKDYYGRWHGPVIIRQVEDKGWTTVYTTEEVNMVRGHKHGMAKITRGVTGSYGKETYVCYNMGHVVDCEKSAVVQAENPSAFQILTANFPAYVVALNTFGFDSSYIKSYTDTVEIVLREYEFEAHEFDVFYEEALDEIDETPYDSIISLNFTITLLNTLEEMKNGDFRLAVIDGYNEGEFNTFGSIQADYFNYLRALNDSGITNNDFEVFCHKFDSLMTSYGDLDSTDPFFTDSLDTRMYRAMDYISSGETESGNSLMALKSAGFVKKELNWENLKIISGMVLKSLFAETTPEMISEIVLLSMFDHYLNSDLIRLAVRKAYMTENNIIRLPVVTTQITDEVAENNVVITGTAVDNGCDEITERGIVWGESYNPTANDQVMKSGSGTGDFNALLTGPEPDKTYYARAYAINSAGIAYGNNVKFVVSPATGLSENDLSAFHVYPNPAKDVVTLSFTKQIGEEGELSIFDLTGKMVFSKKIESGEIPENRLQIDVSGFENGVYNIRFVNGKKRFSQKLVVAH